MPENINTVFRPLHLYSRLFGLTAFSIKMKNDVFVQQTNSFNIFCFTFSTFWNFAMTAIYITHFNNMYDPILLSSEVFETTMFLLSALFLVITIVINWWSFLSQKYFPGILNSLLEVDKILADIGSPVNVKQHKQKMIFTVIFVNVFIVCATYLLDSGKMKENCSINYLISITTFMYLGLNVVVIFHYIFWIWSIKLRYQKINSYLIKNLLSPIKHGINLNIIISAKLHEKLVDASESINRCYGVPVMLNCYPMQVIKKL